MKAVLLTLIFTGCALFVTAKFFFANVLALFGYAAMPLTELAHLTQAKQIVHKMQKRHKSKSANVSKRFIKRSGKKVAVTAVSAATIGTVAVIGTLTYLEISHFCEEKRTLNDDANILFGENDSFDMQACLSQGKHDSANFANEAWQQVKNSSQEIYSSIEQSTDELLDPSRKATVELFESMDRWFEQVFKE